MTEAAPAAVQETAHASQVLNNTETSEITRAGSLPQPDAPKDDAKPLSNRDAIAKAFDDADAKSKADAKPDDTAKVEDATKTDKTVKADADKAAKTRNDDGKFAKAEQPAADKGEPAKVAAERVGNDDRQSEGRKHAEPPARFLPEARTKWANVPNEVKTEFHRVSQEMENEIAQSKTARDRYETIRQYDEIARNNGRELKDSLAKVAEIETALARNPIAGLESILREIGPRKADGSHVSLYEVAQHIVQQGPQQFAQSVQSHQAPQAQQPQESPQVRQLASEVHELKTQLATASVKPMIDTFASSHHDYYALENQIADVLQSGVIDKIYGTGLAPEQKLAEAYRIAGGRAPSHSEPEPAPTHSAAETRRPVIDPDGQKSIAGAPTSGQTGDPKWRPKSNRDALERAFAGVR